MLPYEREAEEGIARDLAGEFAAMERLHNTVVSLFDHWELPTLGADRATVHTVAGLLAKACKTFRAIERVCTHGLGEDATVLARSLYETAVAILFVLQRRKLERQRVAMYHAHMLYVALKMLRGWAETPGLKRRGGKALVANMRAEFDVWVARLPAGANFRKHSSGLANLKEAAEALHGHVSYQAFYRFASSFAHATDVSGHVFVDDTGASSVGLAPGGKHLPVIAAFARVLLWTVASRVDQRYRLGRDRALAAERPPELGRPRTTRRSRTTK